MPGKRSAEAQKRRSEKGARHVYAALQRRETSVAFREVAAARREVMAPPRHGDAHRALNDFLRALARCLAPPPT